MGVFSLKLLLLVILNCILYTAENDFIYDEFSDTPVDKEADMFLIAAGYRVNQEKLVISKTVVSIRTTRPTLYFGDNHYCAGTIIGSNLVVTAAHCVTDQNKIITRTKRIFAVGGTTVRLKRQRTTKEFKIKKVMVHPKYKRKKVNDIALLRLNEGIPPDNDKIRIASLLTEPIPAGTNCSIMGWGQLFLYGPYVNNLLAAPLVILPQKLCKQYYPKGYGKDLICATSYVGSGAGTCRGDSGGPLFCPDSKGTTRLAGVVAWSYQCSGVKPSIFTSINAHHMWIKETNSAPQTLKSSASIVAGLSSLLIFYINTI